MTFAVTLGFLSLFAWIYLALFNGQFWRISLLEKGLPPESWPSVDIIVPARNEADVLPRSLPSLLAQNYPGAWRILLVDDHSEDGTGKKAYKLAADKGLVSKITIVAAPDLPAGWSGKVAAMHAGVKESSADYILFTDADIEHPANSLQQLVERALTRKLDLLSLMVKLHCTTPAEKLLIPAFVFFFALLYPFRQVSDAASRTAAAAGGVMLVKRKALNAIGGLASIKSQLIDDCALAKNIKLYGGGEGGTGSIELAMTRHVKSLRVYADIMDIWRMIARTAYTQLRHSPLLLGGTIIGMAFLFGVPVILPIVADFTAVWLGLLAWFVMGLIYLPMVRFYDLPHVYAALLPAAAVIYIAATIDSARLYWQGKGGQWKGRSQA